MKFTFLSTGHLIGLILRISDTSTEDSDSGQIKAFTFGLLLLLFSPLMTVFAAIDVVVSIVCGYLIPILSIVFMFLIGFPLLKILQMAFMTSEYVYTAGKEAGDFYRDILVMVSKRLFKGGRGSAAAILEEKTRKEGANAHRVQNLYRRFS